MVNLDPFGPRLKLARAQHHIADLENIIDRFVRDHPYTVSINQDSDKGLVIEANFPRPLPDDVSVVIGDVVHNLRSALDHLVGEALRAVNETPNRYTGFPIYETEADFNGGMTSKLARAPSAFIDFVRGLHPYKISTTSSGTGNRALWYLAQLDNLDKHLLLLVSIGLVRLSKLTVFRPDGGVLFQAEGMVLVHGKSNSAIFEQVPHGSKIETNGDSTFAIRFNHSELASGYEVIPFLKMLERKVGSVIDAAAALSL